MTPDPVAAVRRPATSGRPRPARTTAQIVRDYRGPALFSFGFRPFFLLAALWSALAVPLWAWMLAGGEAGVAIDRGWHVHEMLFGYTAAVIAGYLIVAGANWTGRYPVTGRPVMALVALWLAGRVAMLAPVPAWVAAAADLPFLALFAAALWREQVAAGNARNLTPCLVVTGLACANLAFHLRHAWPEVAAVVERLALGAIALLMAVVGGRIVPSFTRNRMAQRRLTPGPAAHDRVDIAGAMLAAVALLLWAAMPDAQLAGALLVLAGVSSLGRLARWRGWRVRADAMVLVLHLGFLWLSLGLLLLGWSVLQPGLVPSSAAIHALTVGAIGVLTLGVMTRMSLSHTGRKRMAGPATLAIYGLVNAAALLRVAAAFVPDLMSALIVLSAACWSAAFLLFVHVHGSMLVRPRRQ